MAALFYCKEGNELNVKDEWRKAARKREQTQSIGVLAGMAAFWAIVITLNHLVHLFSAVYVASAQ